MAINKVVAEIGTGAGTRNSAAAPSHARRSLALMTLCLASADRSARYLRCELGRSAHRRIFQGRDRRSAMGRGRLQSSLRRPAPDRRIAGRSVRQAAGVHGRRRHLHRGLFAVRRSPWHRAADRRPGAGRHRSSSDAARFTGDHPGGVAGPGPARARARDMGGVQRRRPGDRPDARRIADPRIRVAQHLRGRDSAWARRAGSRQANASRVVRPAGARVRCAGPNPRGDRPRRSGPGRDRGAWQTARRPGRFRDLHNRADMVRPPSRRNGALPPLCP